MRLFNHNLEIVRAMQTAGVPLLAGTDTPNPYTYPGFSLHDELELLVSAGLSPAEALQTATLRPAQFLGVEHDFAQSRKGKLRIWFCSMPIRWRISATYEKSAP